MGIDNATMFLKTGFLAVVLLLMSRVLGLLRESAQAAAFGTSGMGDVAVLMLTLPDWVTGVLASGALAYVLLPHWAGQSPELRNFSQAIVARRLLMLGALVGSLLFVFRVPVSRWLASGLSSQILLQAAQGVGWSVTVLPAALLAALWSTRLQYEKDFIGLYAANLVVNGVLIVSLYLMAFDAYFVGDLAFLGWCLGLAMGLRLLWLHLRLRTHVNTRSANQLQQPFPLPGASIWLWAGLSAGLPLTLPFVARSFASAGGEGALATFSYAWKLVELPLVLVVQLVATLAFPAIAEAVSRRRSQVLDEEAIRTIRGAFLIAWTLACACVAALQVGAWPLAHWLFGWGRMPANGVLRVADWSVIGAWSLLPQAIIAVALTVLAATRTMRPVVLAYGLALGAMLICCARLDGDGGMLMAVMDLVLSGVALVAVLKLPRIATGVCKVGALLPWKAMLVPTITLLSIIMLAHVKWAGLEGTGNSSALIACVVSPMILLAVSYLSLAELREALRR